MQLRLQKIWQQNEIEFLEFAPDNDVVPTPDRGCRYKLTSLKELEEEYLAPRFIDPVYRSGSFGNMAAARFFLAVTRGPAT